MTRRLHLLPGLAGANGALYGGWTYEHQAGGPAALAACSAALTVVWPLAALAVVFGLRGTGGALVPYRTLMSWRRGRGCRPHVPAWLRRAVLCADRSRCLWCGSAWNCQIEHVRPYSCGGLACLWNLVVLCGDCNKIKSNYWRYPSGMVVYRPFPGFADIATAAQILAVERHARLNPARWLRAAWALR